MTGLSPGTTYYVRAYATNSEGISYGDEESFTTKDTIPTVSDIDGNIYGVVTIGFQTWMAENLRTTRYADESEIPLVEGTSSWDNLLTTDKAYCWYDNSVDNRDMYGGLYTWAAAMNGAASSDANPSGVQGVCPDGWHLPSDDEWIQLEQYLGMEAAELYSSNWRGTDQGGQLKEDGFAHWNSPNTEATNSSRFTALPGGSRTSSGIFDGLGKWVFYWSTTVNTGSYAWIRFLNYDYGGVFRDDLDTRIGFSVRCAED
jgi:uncharacterized protein (TIGR02145 family)